MALGQGAMLLTAFLLLQAHHPAAGVVTTALGVAALLTSVVDWGGQTLQRQVFSKHGEDGVLEFAAARLPVALTVGILILAWPTEAIGGDEIKQFLLASYLGIAFSIFNMAGALDVREVETPLALLLGLNYLLVAGYVIYALQFDLVFSAGLLGGLNSLGLVASTLLTLSAVNMRPLGTFSLAKARNNFLEGAIISTAMMPGQLIPRSVAVVLLSLGLGGEAALYNFVKSFSGLYAQWVTVIRRAYFREVSDAANVSGSLGMLNCFRNQKKILRLAIIAIVVALILLFLIRGRVQASVWVILILAVHAVVWLVTSSWFFLLQTRGKNSPSAIHALLTCCVVLFALVVLKVRNVESALAVEFGGSFAVFLLLAAVVKRRGT